ncbi:hypothetical protein C7M84_001930 [Penaeus vannamei]|uniref:Uncharacterized protein n=1 Tax=Penaeus vannamei TaxID=6689 RepID=A0A423TSC0_PENVA|nr:hypothetical protein C7M84_001930 [Penaeus vannamei]
MALWSVALAVALVTTKARSTQDDLGMNGAKDDPRGGLSFILPAPYKEPDPQPGTGARNPFLRLKSLEVEAPPQSAVTRKPGIVVRYVDDHEEVFEDDHQQHDLDGERVRRQAVSPEEAGGEADSGRAPGRSGAGPPRESDLGETENGGDEAESGGAEGKSASSGAGDDVKERGRATEGEEQETPQIAVTSEPSVAHGEDETRAPGVTAASNANRSLQNRPLTRTTDGAEGLGTEAETTTAKRARQRERQPPSGRELADVQEMSSSLGFSVRQYYQDLLNYYSLYQVPSNPLALDPGRAAYEAPGAESGIYAHTPYDQSLPHYYVVYPYGSSWAPAGGSALKQNFRPAVSEAAERDVYRLTMDQLQEALRAPRDQPDDEEPPNPSAIPPTNPNEPQMNPEKPPANPNEDPTNPQEPPSASEARTPSRIPNQLRTLFSRVGRGSAPSCQAGKCEAGRDATTTAPGVEEGDDPPPGSLGGRLRYTQPFVYTFPLSRRGLSWPFGYDLARAPVHYPSTHLVGPHRLKVPSAYFEPRDREPTSGNRPHGSYTPSKEHAGWVQDGQNGNGAGDTTRLTYASLSPSNHDRQAYSFLTERDATGLPPHEEAAYELQFPVESNPHAFQNNREYQASERAQIVLANPLQHEPQFLTGDQALYQTHVDNAQKVSDAQGKHQQGEGPGARQPVYGFRLVSGDRTELHEEQPYYLSVAEDAREEVEPEPVIVQEDRRQRNYETLYPFVIVHHGQEL